MTHDADVAGRYDSGTESRIDPQTLCFVCRQPVQTPARYRGEPTCRSCLGGVGR